MVTDLAARWSTWLDVLEAHGFTIREIVQPGATTEEIAALEAVVGLRLTGEIRAFYQLSNGQRLRPTLGMIRDGRAEPLPPGAAPLFGFYEFLDTHGAAGEWALWQSIDDQQGPDGMLDMAEAVFVSEPDKVKKQYWIPGWLPFARDGGGNGLAFDFDPEPAGTVGQIIVVGSDEDHRRVLAPSIGELVQRLVDEWRGGRYEIERDESDDVRHYDLPFLRGEPSSGHCRLTRSRRPPYDTSLTKRDLHNVVRHAHNQTHPARVLSMSTPSESRRTLGRPGERAAVTSSGARRGTSTDQSERLSALLAMHR